MTNKKRKKLRFNEKKCVLAQKRAKNQIFLVILCPKSEKSWNQIIENS